MSKATAKVAPSPDLEAPDTSAFGVSPDKLNELNENKDTQGLRVLGSALGLAKALQVDVHRGVDPTDKGPASIEARKEAFGANILPQTPPKSFLGLVWENLHDPIVIVLVLAATVSTVLGAAIKEQREHGEYIEGVAIWVAILIVVSVGAGNDYKKDQQFRKLNAHKDKIRVKVLRGGHTELVENTEIVVGDVYILDTGDKLVADGVLLDTQGLVIDEASLTGESDPIKKSEEDPWIRSGTQVSEGSGKILVTAVGTKSEWGKTIALINAAEAEDDETPLQHKLTVIASTVGKVGVCVAVACFIALLVKWCIINKGFPVSRINQNGPIQFFLFSITIIVVAVPEGLPLAVTISLAYSMGKMMKDNNFVRVLAACETMGGASAICSDKTGTLTENRMTVVEGWFAGTKFDHLPEPSELPADVADELRLNCALNSKAFIIEENGKLDFAGNRTECALLLMLRTWGTDYNTIREEYETRLYKLYGFSSAKKMASALIKFEDKFRLYNKGAAEWVLKRCVSMYNAQGQVVPMSDADRDQLLEVVTAMAKRGLRCICITYTDLPLQDPARPDDFFEDSDNVDKNLICMAIVGIKDPVRKEVPEAVRVCQAAGITVRMVTGDNIHTAQHIARECGILGGESFIALEGPVFRKMSAQELLPLLPNLRVLARSSPEDKLTLVSMLKKQGDVVAVTGDGTNDAPALKEADVGLAMGIAGTEVAKEAADIVILDDNFGSIVKSVMWGRCVFSNIRKFLMFQLTVNFVALVISFFGAVIGGHEPLNVLQLLWVNLIMDTLGALALATEEPNPELLLMKPYGRTESLITPIMWKHILVQGLYQIFWMFFFLYAVPLIWDRYDIMGKKLYYLEYCDDHIGGKDGYTGEQICAVMNFCGYPYDQNELLVNSPACPVWETLWKNATLPVVPQDKQVLALCGPNVKGCSLNDVVKKAQEEMDKEFYRHEEEDYRAPLSVLFNIFIFCQIFNEINARRINDEYTIFVGLFTNPVFMGVLFVTVCLQVMIINIPGLNTAFFKVQPLDWDEWLLSIAIGAFTVPLSLLTRYISRNWGDVTCLRGTRVHVSEGRTLSGRTVSGNIPTGKRSSTSGGRTVSGRTTSGRTVSGQHAHHHAPPAHAAAPPMPVIAEHEMSAPALSGGGGGDAVEAYAEPRMSGPGNAEATS